MKRNQSELKLERECCDIARSAGLASVKIEKNGHTGVPDRLFIADGGDVLFVEFKRPDGRGNVSDEQSFWLSFLGAGGVLVDSVEGFKSALFDRFKIKVI